MPPSRLVHSPNGFLRYMQMSAKTLFAFVEGIESDSFVYGEICANVCSKRNLKYDLNRANQVPPNAGGKTALLGFHDFLSKRKSLKSRFKGKKTVAVFFLDKDIDDILRLKRRSRHIIYTRYYDVQNEIFLNGNLIRGCASSASIDPSVLVPSLSNSRLWCSRAAERWREWVILCLMAARKCIPHQCNFRVHSQIQCPVTGQTDAGREIQMRLQMAIKSGVSAKDFKTYYNSIRKQVTKVYSKGEQDRIFKGKWYSALLDEEIKRIMGATEYDKTSFAARVTSSVAATLDFSETWTNHYSNPLMKLMDPK